MRVHLYAAHCSSLAGAAASSAWARLGAMHDQQVLCIEVAGMGCWQVQALDSLAKALLVEVLELRRERARALSSRGLWGHFKNLLGYLLSAYCLFK